MADDVDIGELAENKLLALKDRITGRLLSLRRKKQDMLAELAPMDAAIFELEQVLRSMGIPLDVGVLEQPNTPMNFMSGRDMPSIGITQQTYVHKTGAGNPLDMTRDVEEPKRNGKSPVTVARTGSPPTNVEVLKDALGIGR